MIWGVGWEFVCLTTSSVQKNSWWLNCSGSKTPFCLNIKLGPDKSISLNWINYKDYFSRQDKQYCANCFGELFAKRCNFCKKPITGTGGTKFISFEGRHWHSGCFQCAACQVKFFVFKMTLSTFQTSKEFFIPGYSPRPHLNLDKAGAPYDILHTQHRSLRPAKPHFPTAMRPPTPSHQAPLNALTLRTDIRLF